MTTFATLHYRCIQGTATAAEMEEFKALLRMPEHADEASRLLMEAYEAPLDWMDMDPATAATILNTIVRADDEQPADEVKKIPVTTHRVHFLRTAWFRYAAILLLVMGTATYIFFYQSSRQKGTRELTTAQPDIMPGGNKAMLTLSDGSIILLDSVANGSLADQGKTKILKLDAGTLAYKGGDARGEALFNTLTTPRGGQYQIVLPDGTKVWLNAASSIRFPTTFGRDRTVEVTGESFFEVTVDPSKPFHVKAGGVTIQVLGTSFNVNAYPDEAGVKTSLLEGSLRVDNRLLKPGQAFEEGKVVPTNIQRDIAWKQGFFSFENADIQTVMRQLARWYDVDIRYEGKMGVHKFKGNIDRDVSLSEWLEILPTFEVNVRQVGRILYVSPR